MRLAATSSFAILLAASTPAFAQDEVARKQAVELAATRVPLEKATTGAPYSAETLVENVQTLADGNRIVRKTTGRVYRDGEGRTRREEEGQVMTARTPNGPVTANRRTTISIVDPVGGFSYSLDPERKIAWRTTIGASAAIMEKIAAVKAEMDAARAELEKRAARTAGATDKPSTEAQAAEERKVLEAQKREAAGGGGRGVGVGRGVGGGTGGEVRMRGAAIMADNPGPLEHKTLEGIPVEGRKTTTVIPAGQVGNEQPLTIVSEEWRSPDLNVLVFTRHSDPRTGESTYRLTNVIRAEPDRSLFMVPPDYEVRETGIRKMLESKQ
jgi:hypothetical protein